MPLLLRPSPCILKLSAPLHLQVQTILHRLQNDPAWYHGPEIVPRIVFSLSKPIDLSMNCRALTYVQGGVVPPCEIIDVGDAEGLDGHGSDAQQQLPQQQQGVHPPLGVALLQAAALIGRGGGLAERAVETGG